MKMPWFKFCPAEYMSGTIMFCSNSTQGIFVRIMCLCWQRSELPRDPELLAKLVGTTNGELETAISELDKYEIIQDTKPGLFTLKFMAEQIEQAKKERASKSFGGKKGMLKRWSKINN